MPAVCSLPTYERRQPEESVLYRTLEAHLDTFLARTGLYVAHPPVWSASRTWYE